MRLPRWRALAACSPDERSEIRDGVRVVPDLAALIRATTSETAARPRQLDTSHGCQNHTLLPYATTPLVQRGSIAHNPKTSLRPPCNASRAQRHRVHRNPHSTYRDDAYAPLR